MTDHSEKPWEPSMPLRVDAASDDIVRRGRWLYGDLGAVTSPRISPMPPPRELAAAVSVEKGADTKRMEHIEDWLDGFEFVERGDIQRHVRLDWFAGDGGGHWFTEGKTFREAIDKSLNHEAQKSDAD